VSHGIAYKLNDCAYGWNGRAIQTDSAATIDANVDTLYIGNYTAGTSVGIQYIARITYYPLRISNNELQRMTIQ
jgi:hypothetical protein